MLRHSPAATGPRVHAHASRTAGACSQTTDNSDNEKANKMLTCTNHIKAQHTKIHGAGSRVVRFSHKTAFGLACMHMHNVTAQSQVPAVGALSNRRSNRFGKRPSCLLAPTTQNTNTQIHDRTAQDQQHTNQSQHMRTAACGVSSIACLHSPQAGDGGRVATAAYGAHMHTSAACFPTTILLHSRTRTKATTCCQLQLHRTCC
jgi:hypothetical protein